MSAIQVGSVDVARATYAILTVPRFLPDAEGAAAADWEAALPAGLAAGDEDWLDEAVDAAGAKADGFVEADAAPEAAEVLGAALAAAGAALGAA